LLRSLNGSHRLKLAVKQPETLSAVRSPDRGAPPEAELGGRAHPRYRVDAHAIWNVNGLEIRWPVWTLSWGGASLVTGVLRVPEGLRRKIRLVQPRGLLGTAEAEIVHNSLNRVGLRFLEIDKKLHASLEALFAELTPIP